MVKLTNILVATDFSEPSAVAMAYGRDLARTYGARLHVLHVVEDLATRFASEASFVLPDVQADFERIAADQLARVVTDDDRKTLDIVTAVQTDTNVAEGIIAYARSKAIDLIVTGTHGRGGVKHLLIGSVAERVVRNAPCPVLTVHVHERDFIAPDALVAGARA